jgi:hypothetical protein
MKDVRKAPKSSSLLMESVRRQRPPGLFCRPVAGKTKALKCRNFVFVSGQIASGYKSSTTKNRDNR